MEGGPTFLLYIILLQLFLELLHPLLENNVTLLLGLPCLRRRFYYSTAPDIFSRHYYLFHG